MKDFEQCCNEVAKKYGFDSIEKGFKALPISNLYKEAAQLYASECVKEAVKLARYQMGDISGSLEPNPYTKQEILNKLKL